MAGNDWNSFMQSKRARLVLYGISVFFCLGYALDAFMELMSPERAAAQIAMLGEGTFYALTIGRGVVLLITGIAFARVVYKTYREEDK